MKSKSVFPLLAMLFLLMACSPANEAEKTNTTNENISTAAASIEEVETPTNTVPTAETEANQEENTTTIHQQPSAQTVANEKPVVSEPVPVKPVEKSSNQTSPKETVTSQVETPKEKVESPELVEEQSTLDHGLFDQQLRKFVSGTGTVNYAGWKAEEAKLDQYLAELAKAIPGSDWSRNAQMAYWINAYNAFTVKLILKNYPVKSITNLHGGKPWDVKWIKLAGKSYSLNQIENDILRPRYGDARIHFAVNCAALSCPPLLNQAYTESNLNSKLATNTRKFINNTKFNTISAESATVSKIFEWYAGDFGDLKGYLNKYSGTKLGEGAQINYQEYDWALNGK